MQEAKLKLRKLRSHVKSRKLSTSLENVDDNVSINRTREVFERALQLRQEEV
jgi:hypothetical protein